MSKARASRESDRMVDVSPNSGGRSGKYPLAKPVTSMITSDIIGEGTVSLENVLANSSRPDSLKRNVFVRLRWAGSQQESDKV